MSIGIISSQFNPRQLSNTVNWVDGADPAGNGVLPANNTALSTWVDKSAFSYNFTQASGGNQALFKTNVVGNKGSILFDGSDDYFSRAYTANLFTSNTTIAIVYSVALLDNNFISLMTTRTNSAPYYGHAFYRTPNNASPPTDAAKYSVLIGNGGGGGWVGSLLGPLATLNTPTLIIMNASGGTATLYVNGVTYNSLAYAAGGTPTHFLGCGGGDSSPGLYWNGYIHERVIRNVGSTSDELSILTNYLKTKWGIA